jgi:carbon storage regulator CsrA
VLVLARREGESIRIGHDIIVSVVEVRGGGVVFSIDAPPEVAVVAPSERNPSEKKGGPRERDAR